MSQNTCPALDHGLDHSADSGCSSYIHHPLSLWRDRSALLARQESVLIWPLAQGTGIRHWGEKELRWGSAELQESKGTTVTLKLWEEQRGLGLPKPLAPGWASGSRWSSFSPRQDPGLRLQGLGALLPLTSVLRGKGVLRISWFTLLGAQVLALAHSFVELGRSF